MLYATRKYLSKYIMEPLFWQIKNVPVRRYYREFKQLQFSSETAFDARQKQRLCDIIAHTLDTVPYYKNYDSPALRRLLSTDPHGCLKSFPVVTKAQFRSKVQMFRSETPIESVKNRSGGSTGEPVVVFQDLAYKAASIAATDCLFGWAGRDIGDRLIKLWGAERDFVQGNYGLKQRLSDFIGNRKTLNAFNMSPSRMLEYVILMASERGVCLEGYSDSLFSLACFIDDNNHYVIAPKSIVSSAGMLLPHMRTKIESVFASRVFDRYVCREAGNLAAECRMHDGLHVFGETTIIEVLDENGKEVRQGEQGRVVVTNLHNRSMPLIRYEIGDFAEKGAENCNCGLPYPKLKKIVGRSGAIFRTRHGGYVLPEFFIHLIGVMYNDGEIAKFQVVQEDQETIVVNLVLKENHDLKNWRKKYELAELIRKAMKDNINVEFRQKDDIEPTATGKFLYTISNL